MPLALPTLTDLAYRLAHLFEVPVRGLADTLAPLAGTTPDAAVLDLLGWRLAGNRPRLTLGLAVPLRPGNPEPAWTAAQVTAVHRRPAGQKPGAELAVRCLCGPAAGLALSAWWSRAAVHRHARAFGFSRRTRPPLPLRAPEELVNLRAWLLLPAFAPGEEPRPLEVRSSPQLAAWNRDLTRRRRRLDPAFSCPLGRHPLSDPCHQCPRGYRACPAGTHRDDWVAGDCPECRRPDAALDPARPGKCVDCRRRAAHWPG